jgi:hypothetical protein
MQYTSTHWHALACQVSGVRPKQRRRHRGSERQQIPQCGAQRCYSPLLQWTLSKLPRVNVAPMPAEQKCLVLLISFVRPSAQDSEMHCGGLCVDDEVAQRNHDFRPINVDAMQNKVNPSLELRLRSCRASSPPHTSCFPTVRNAPDGANRRTLSLAARSSNGYRWVETLPMCLPRFRPCVRLLVPEARAAAQHGEGRSRQAARGNTGP